MLILIFADWYKEHSDIELLALGESVKDADLVINATNGGATLDVFDTIGADNL